jgi:hypothetical protein
MNSKLLNKKKKDLPTFKFCIKFFDKYSSSIRLLILDIYKKIHYMKSLNALNPRATGSLRKSRDNKIFFYFFYLKFCGNNFLTKSHQTSNHLFTS